MVVLISITKPWSARSARKLSRARTRSSPDPMLVAGPGRRSPRCSRPPNSTTSILMPGSSSHSNASLADEQWVAEIDQIIRTYRSADAGRWSARQEAIKQLRDLGLTEGDALRYLGKPGMPAHKPKRV